MMYPWVAMVGGPKVEPKLLVEATSQWPSLPEVSSQERQGATQVQLRWTWDPGWLELRWSRYQGPAITSSKLRQWASDLARLGGQQLTLAMVGGGPEEGRLGYQVWDIAPDGAAERRYVDQAEEALREWEELAEEEGEHVYSDEGPDWGVVVEALIESLGVAAVVDEGEDGAVYPELAVDTVWIGSLTGDRRLDGLIETIRAGASHEYEEQESGQVMVRLEVPGGGRQMSFLSPADYETLRRHTMKPTDRVGELRSVLQGAPSDGTWQALVDHLQQWPRDEATSRELIPYLERHLISWPDALRIAPNAWILDLFEGREAAPLRLARELHLPPELAARLDADAAERMTRAPQLAALRVLRLDHARLGNVGTRHLASCPHLANLRELSLAHCRLGDASARALARAPQLAGLERLALGGNRFTEAGWQALHGAEHLSQEVKQAWIGLS